MPILAEQYDDVIGGDPDRDTLDLAVLDTATAGVRAHLTQLADAAGYDRMLSWAQHHAPGARVWALEGTGTTAPGWSVFWPRRARTWSRSTARRAGGSIPPTAGPSPPG